MAVCLLIEFLFFFVFVNAGLREQIANLGSASSLPSASRSPSSL